MSGKTGNDRLSIQNYDFVLFVDASGCDGIKFEAGSSSCYAVAGYLVAKEYIQDDIQTLQKIRRIISGDPNRELKYSTLRRHNKREQAFAEFGKLHGHAIGRVAFKKVLVERNQFNSGGKIFSVLMHAIAITFLETYSEVAGKKVLIVVDRMKNTEEVPVQHLAEGTMHDTIKTVAGYDLIFRDSKDKEYQLIQIADFISGILREFFEQYEDETQMKNFWNTCPLCKNNHNRHLCGKTGKKKRSTMYSASNFRYIINLFPETKPMEFIRCLTFLPTDILERVFFLFCFKI